MCPGHREWWTHGRDNIGCVWKWTTGLPDWITRNKARHETTKRHAFVVQNCRLQKHDSPVRYDIFNIWCDENNNIFRARLCKDYVYFGADIQQKQRNAYFYRWNWIMKFRLYNLSWMYMNKINWNLRKDHICNVVIIIIILDLISLLLQKIITFLSCAMTYFGANIQQKQRDKYRWN